MSYELCEKLDYFTKFELYKKFLCKGLFFIDIGFQIRPQ